MSERLVTAGTFGTPIEASIVRSHLEAEGIRAFVADEATVGMAWHLGTAVGGVKVQLAEDDVERAVCVIEALGTASIADNRALSGILVGCLLAIGRARDSAPECASLAHFVHGLTRRKPRGGTGAAAGRA